MSNEIRLGLVDTYSVDFSELPHKTVVWDKRREKKYRVDTTEGAYVNRTVVPPWPEEVIWEPGFCAEPTRCFVNMRRFGGTNRHVFSQTGRWPGTATEAREFDLDPASLDFGRCASNCALPILPAGTRFSTRSGTWWTIYSFESEPGMKPSHYRIVSDDGRDDEIGRNLIRDSWRNRRLYREDALLESVLLPNMKAEGGLCFVTTALFDMPAKIRAFKRMAEETVERSAHNPLYW